MEEQTQVKTPETVTIAAPLTVLSHRTIKKGSGWWLAVVLTESWGKKAVGLYLWQRRQEQWKRKQKFTIHTQEKWHLIKEAVEGFVQELK